jgi:DNA-binding NtrC family response regulator
VAGTIESESMATILLAGEDAALLEGLAQLFATLGHSSTVVRTLAEARETSRRLSPLVSVVDRTLLGNEQTLGLSAAAGGATLLFGQGDEAPRLLPAQVRRAVLADLTLPLERNRRVALVQRVVDRAETVGRRTRNTPPETPALR